MKIFIAGLVMFFGSLWLGAYLTHLAGNEWWGFPAFMTAVICAVVGIVLMAASVELDRG